MTAACRDDTDPLAKADRTRLAVIVAREGRMYKGHPEVRSEAGTLLNERGPGAGDRPDLCRLIGEET